MKPIKLTLSAFGSYVNPEVVDFTHFYDKGIFLITGPTGAGKTTIFDGICYALYGRTSNSDKDENYIRNDLAEDSIETYVELHFELRDNKYFIKRSPKQLRKKLRGDGYTEKPAEAELRLLDENRVITGITEVNDKIIELIGLEYEQFKQIIMIPQGEFRQLIIAKSREREEILRKIFGTIEYKKVQEALDKKTKALKGDIEKLEERLKANIGSINHGDNEGLKAIKDKVRPTPDELLTELKVQISNDKVEIKSFDERIISIDNEIKKIASDITEGKNINTKLEQKAKIEDEKVKLEALKGDMEEKAAKLEKGKKALIIIPIEEQYNGSVEKVQGKEKELEKLDRDILDAKNDFELANEEYDRQSKRSEEGDKLKNNIGVLNSYLSKVKSYDENKRKRDNLTIEFNDLKRKLDKKETSIKSLRDKVNQLKCKIDSLKNCDREYDKQRFELEKLDDIYTKLNDIIPLAEDVERFNKDYLDEDLKLDSLQKQLEVSKKKALKLRRLFIEGYAGKLAMELDEGSPCPVCGSTHHPSPAELIDTVPKEEELQEADEALNRLDEKLNQTREIRDSFKSQRDSKQCLIDEKLKDVADALDEALESSQLQGSELIAVIGEKTKGLDIQKNELNKKLAKLSSQIKEREQAEKDLVTLDKQADIEEKGKNELSAQYTKVYGDLESHKKLVEELEKELPEDIRSEESLNAKIKALETQVKEIEASIKKAQENLQACSENYNSLIKVKEERIKQLKDLKLECQDLENRLEDQILSQGFKNRDDYTLSKLTNNQLNVIDNEIKAYHENLKSVNDRYKQIVEETKGIKAVDIKALEDKLLDKQNERTTVNNLRTAVYSRLENNTKVLDNLKSTYKVIAEKEEEYSLIGELSSVSNGRNSYKITFETFVLAAYFEEVIEAANIRLRKMTKNRFQMERVKDEGSGNAFKGLDINIYDANSGQCRPIKNISGGESFKASLSLALGLADVVQSHAGGIRLDTMFVDEGFGSLNSASLDDAINCLLELQSSGRLVGIISHVNELKERIHSRIEVVPGVNGSRTRCI